MGQESKERTIEAGRHSSGHEPGQVVRPGVCCAACAKGRKTTENAKALPVQGVSPGDLTPYEKKRIENISNGIQLRTAAGDLTTNESVSVTPFGGNNAIDALVLPDSPAFLSLGKLCGENGYSYWPNGGAPEITLPTGKSFQLDVINRIPVLPMGFEPERGRTRRLKHKYKTGCPVSQTGGASSSSDLDTGRAGKPVAEHADPETGDDAATLEGDIPPDHFLTHTPKHAKCEACQASKMQHRQCRRKDEDHEIDKYPARKFGDVVTADHLSSYAEESISIDGDMFALVLRDKYTGWLDCYATGTKSAEDTTEALQHFVGPTEKVNLPKRLTSSTPTTRQN